MARSQYQILIEDFEKDREKLMVEVSGIDVLIAKLKEKEAERKDAEKTKKDNKTDPVSEN